MMTFFMILATMVALKIPLELIGKETEELPFSRYELDKLAKLTTVDEDMLKVLKQAKDLEKEQIKAIAKVDKVDELAQQYGVRVNINHRLSSLSVGTDTGIFDAWSDTVIFNGDQVILDLVLEMPGQTLELLHLSFCQRRRQAFGTQDLSHDRGIRIFPYPGKKIEKPFRHWHLFIP